MAKKIFFFVLKKSLLDVKKCGESHGDVYFALTTPETEIFAKRHNTPQNTIVGNEANLLKNLKKSIFRPFPNRFFPTMDQKAVQGWY